MRSFTSRHSICLPDGYTSNTHGWSSLHEHTNDVHYVTRNNWLRTKSISIGCHVPRARKGGEREHLRSQRNCAKTKNFARQTFYFLYSSEFRGPDRVFILSSHIWCSILIILIIYWGSGVTGTLDNIVGLLVSIHDTAECHSPSCEHRSPTDRRIFCIAKIDDIATSLTLIYLNRLTYVLS